MKKIDIKTVVVTNSFITYSGTLISNKYILITSHLLNSIEFKEKINQQKFWVIQQGSDHYITQEVFLIGNLFSDNINNVVKNFLMEFYDWSNSSSNIIDLFTINVLSFDRSGSVDELKEIWRRHNVTGLNHVKIADEVIIRAAPFGSRQLINSYSQGIISNNLYGILLTDCSTTIGSEGGIILLKRTNKPLAIVILAMAGWRGEWTGLTIGLSFDLLFNDKVNYYDNNKILPLLSRTISTIEQKICNSLVYVKSGINWGTGICIDEENHIILTNSHVIANDNLIEIITHGISSNAKLIFKVPHNEQFDLAILQYKDTIPNLKRATLSIKQLHQGDEIFTAGFPLFPHGLINLQPTITKGHVALIKPNVIMTTCIVLPGASGGALFNNEGHVIGVVTCNIMNKQDNCSYPWVNMNIPINRIAPILRKYLITKDVRVLKRLYIQNESIDDWKISKL